MNAKKLGFERNIHKHVYKHGSASPEDRGHLQAPALPREKCAIAWHLNWPGKLACKARGAWIFAAGENPAKQRRGAGGSCRLFVLEKFSPICEFWEEFHFPVAFFFAVCYTVINERSVIKRHLIYARKGNIWKKTNLYGTRNPHYLSVRHGHPLKIRQ